MTESPVKFELVDINTILSGPRFSRCTWLRMYDGSACSGQPQCASVDE